MGATHHLTHIHIHIRLTGSNPRNTSGPNSRRKDQGISKWTWDFQVAHKRTDLGGIGWYHINLTLQHILVFWWQSSSAVQYLSIWLSIHRITLTGYDTRSHLLSFLQSRRIANLCQSFFPQSLPPQATEARPADRQMLYSKCSPYALRRPLSNCDCCSGCSSHQTIRFQATFTGSRCAAAQGHDTTRVYSARSVAGKRATVRTSSKS